MSSKTQSGNKLGIETPMEQVRPQLFRRGFEKQQDGTMTLESPLNTDSKEFEYYTVYGHQLCMESKFVEFAMAGLAQISSHSVPRSGLKVSALEFREPLVISSDYGVSLCLQLKEVAENSYNFAMLSTNDGEFNEIIHCTGEIRHAPLPAAVDRILETEEELEQRRARLIASEHEVFTTRTIYQKVLGQAIEYRPETQRIRKIRLSVHSAELFAHCDLPSGHAERIPGMLVDTMLQASMFKANMITDCDNFYLYHGVQRISMLSNIFASNPAFDVYCQNVTDSGDLENIVIDAYAIQESKIITIVHGICFSLSTRFKIQARVDSAVFARSKYDQQLAGHPNSPGDHFAMDHMEIRSLTCMDDDRNCSESSTNLYS